MSKFKVGQLVMLIKYNPNVPTGAIGEVILSDQNDPVDTTAVRFERHPSLSHTGCWWAPHDYLIPLSDPDADISDTYEQPIKNKEDV